MNTTVRLAAVYLLAALSTPFALAADAPVIERAPDADQSAAQAEVTSLRVENERLKNELTAATVAKATSDTALQVSTRELGRLRAKVAQLDTKPAADLEARLAIEKTRADEASSRLNTLAPLLDQLTQEKTTLEAKLAASRDATAQLAEAQKRLTTLQADNNLLKAAAADHARLASELERLRQEKPATPPAPDLTAKLAETEEKLAMALRSYSQLQAESEKTKASSDELDALRAQFEKLRREKTALEDHLAALPADRTGELSDKLTTALNSYNQLQAENEQLKTAAAARAAELNQLSQDKAELEARLAAAATPPPAPVEATPAAADSDVAGKLAETEDKLSTALRSYSLLSAELDQLKTDSAAAAEQAAAASAKAAAEAAAAAAKAAAEASAQIAALRDEVRQTQAQVSALATENSQLKTRLALSGPPPGSTMATPVRPGTPAASAALQPTPVPMSAPEAAEPAAGPRTHVIVAGDNLAKLARRYYGNPNRWDEILRANRDVIKNENVLPLGATLRIP